MTLSRPKSFFKQQVLWFEHVGDKAINPMLLVKVLDVKLDTVEITFLSSDGSCYWVNKTQLWEITDSITR